MLLHDREDGERETPVGAAIPVPVREAVTGEPGAVYETVTVPDLVPTEAGVSVTVTVHEEFAASVLGAAGQSDDIEKSLRLIDRDEMLIEWGELFVNVNFRGTLGTPTLTFPKSSLTGVRDTAGRG